MFDVLALLVLFLVLIGTLALFQYLPKWFKSKDPALALRLLEEWLQVHSVSMPTVEEVIAILNKQIDKSLESKVCRCSWMHVCVCECVCMCMCLRVHVYVFACILKF